MKNKIKKSIQTNNQTFYKKIRKTSKEFIKRIKKMK